MALFIPGSVVQARCSLCDGLAVHVAKIKMRISDKVTGKEVVTEVDIHVCQAHSRKMDIEVFKKVASSKKKLIIN